MNRSRVAGCDAGRLRWVLKSSSSGLEESDQGIRRNEGKKGSLKKKNGDDELNDGELTRRVEVEFENRDSGGARPWIDGQWVRV